MATTAIYSTLGAAAPITVSISDRLLRYLGRGAAKRELSGLSAAQLKDAGIDPSAVFSGPVIEVDAATMGRLTSFR